MEPSRSVEINLSMKSVPTEMRIKFLGKFFCETFCHQTGTMLPMSTIWTFSSCMFSKEGMLQRVQWTSPYSAVSRKNPKLRISGSKMCKLWRETFCKQQSLQCSPGKMQRKMNNAMSRILATKQSPPPPVTSTAFPATLTGDIDTRKRVMSDTSVLQNIMFRGLWC